MPKSDDGKKHYCWCFTINNYTDVDIGELRKLISALSGPAYVCAGKENAPTTGTPHLQCFAYWSSKTRGQRFSWIRKRLTRASDIAPMYSTKEHCIEYCSKDGDILEFGTKPILHQGKRNDLEAVRVALLEGTRMNQIAMNHFGTYIKYHRGLEKAHALFSRANHAPRSWKTEVYWLYGPAEYGKSHWGNEKFPDACRIEYQNGFFSPYNGERVVIFDDYDHESMNEELMCRLFDKYKMTVRQIGGWSNWNPEVIVVTSNYPPPSTARIMRRIENVYEFHTGPPTYSFKKIKSA